VVALAADRVYLSPGARAGVLSGARVRIHGRDGVFSAVVDAVTASRAAVLLDDAAARVALGDPAVIEQGAAAPAGAPPNVRVGPRGAPEELYRDTLATSGPTPPLIVAAVDRERASSGGTAADRPTGWHGLLGLSALALHDGTASRLDFYQVRLDSRLTGSELLGGHLRYDHRISVQGEFGPGLSQRPGYASRRWVRADWLYATYLPIAGGPYSISAGRMLPAGPALLGPSDGIRLGYQRRGMGVSLGAGLAARPSNLFVDPRSLRADVSGYFTGHVHGVELRGDVSAYAAYSDGRPDRAAFVLAFTARMPRRFDFYGYGELGWLPADLRSPARGGFGLDRLHAFGSIHLRKGIDLSVRYSLDRPVIDRFLALVLPSEYLRQDLRQVTGASLRLRFGMATVEPYGDLDVSSGYGLRWRAGARAMIDGLPRLGTRLSFHAQHGQGAFQRTSSLGARLGQQLTDRVDVWAAYTITLVDEAKLQEVYLLHSAVAGVQWLITRRLSASLEAAYDRGTYENLWTGFVQLHWWF
jgi:hypothetical protein